MQLLSAVIPFVGIAGCMGLIEGWKSFEDCSGSRCQSPDASSIAPETPDASSPQVYEENNGTSPEAKELATMATGETGSGNGDASLNTDAVDGAAHAPTKEAGISVDAGAVGDAGAMGDAGTVGDAGGKTPTETCRIPTPKTGNHRNALAIGKGYASPWDRRNHSFSCASTDVGELYCWGSNIDGELGLGLKLGEKEALSINEMKDPTRVILPRDLRSGEITAGAYHACARIESGPVYCWGLTAPVGLPTSMRYSASPDTIDFDKSVDDDIEEIAAGADHICARRRVEGDVVCRGENDFNQLGRAAASAEPATTAEPVGLDWHEFQAVQLTAGQDFTCALGKNQSVWCWGRNNLGQLGRSLPDSSRQFAAVALPENTQVLEVTAGQSHACARDQLGRVFCWGSNEQGEISPNAADRLQPVPPVQIPLTLPAVLIRAGAHHTCARLCDRTIWCWGDNSVEQLGSAEIASPSGPVLIPLTFPADIQELAVGGRHSCVLRTNHRIQCWGGSELERGGTDLWTMRELQ